MSEGEGPPGLLSSAVPGGGNPPRPLAQVTISQGRWRRDLEAGWQGRWPLRVLPLLSEKRVWAVSNMSIGGKKSQTLDLLVIYQSLIKLLSSTHTCRYSFCKPLHSFRVASCHHEEALLTEYSWKVSFLWLLPSLKKYPSLTEGFPRARHYAKHF